MSESNYDKHIENLGKELAKHISPEVYAEVGYILSLMEQPGDSEEVKADKHARLMALKKEQDRKNRERRKAEREARMKAREQS